MVLLFATSKKYDKVLYTPHNEVIARSYCDETLPKPMEKATGNNDEFCSVEDKVKAERRLYSDHL